MAGVAATRDFVFLAGRDLEDKNDVFQCLAADDGGDVWEVTVPAEGSLDYGNSPRATPLVHGDFIFFQGAFGDLVCVDLESGETVWKRNLYSDFRSEIATWGACSSPLLADGKLIVNPGASAASLVALDPLNGKVIWQTAGRAAGYGSLIQARLAGVDQIVGHDQETLGGWELKSGTRLWEVKPPHRGDFNVPTPIVIGECLFVVTENNGSRFYEFGPSGRILPSPVAHNDDLAPDTSTPVAVNQQIVGCSHDLIALDLNQKLRTSSALKGEAFRGHVSLMASENKLIVIGHNGEMQLISVRKDRLEVISCAKLFSGKVEIYSHPALVGSRLYVRGARQLVCIDLS